MADLAFATPLRELITDADLPLDFLTASDGVIGDVLDKCYFSDYAVLRSTDGIGAAIELVIAGEAALALPGLDGFSFVIGSDGAGATVVDASCIVGPDGVGARLDKVAVALRFPPSILRPTPDVFGGAAPAYAEIEVQGSVIFEDGDVRFDGFDALSLKPAMIADTGIVISADDVKLDFSRTTTIPEVAAAGFDDSFMGVYIGEAKVQLPAGLPELAPKDLVLRRTVIGSGGVSGRLEAHYVPVYDATTKTFSGPGAGTMFDIPFGLNDVALEFKQNAFKESALTGKMLFPFFDEPLDVHIGINLDGSFAVGLSGSSGLLTLTKPNVLELTVDSLGFEEHGGVFLAKMSGKLKPLFGAAVLDWPEFDVKELSIDSKGNVKLDGGWLDLPSQYTLDLYGFKLEITKLGFGKTDDGGKWIGFSGGLKLVDGMPDGASVEGLRIIWYDDGITRMTLNGVGVELVVPGVLDFKGDVSYNSGLNQFAGDIKLNLVALDLEVDATLVFGTGADAAGKYTYFAIYLDVELPGGIPLFATGLGLYGMAGLFAEQMEPNKKPTEEWYAWYKRPPPPDPSVVDLTKKWQSARGSLAFGAGMTVGTLADNGYTFSGQVLLVMVFPGPTLLIVGMANLLKPRASLSQEPMFRALAVLDNQAKTFLIDLDAKYKYDESTGQLIDVRGGAEAYYEFNDPSKWHLYLGERTPREKRIHAQLFRLFEADAYLMIDAHQLATGAWVGYDKHWKFGPLHVDLAAWLDGNAIVSFHPVHLHGDLWLHGSAGLTVFGFGLNLTVDARFAADVFDPFDVKAELSVGMKPPWPFKEIDVDITLEWGPVPTPPPLPLPLKEITVEHFKVTTSWPLPRGSLLEPNYDTGDGFLTDTPAAVSLAARPVVPLDARPHLTFARPVNDDALVGVNAQAVTPESERIGDPVNNVGPALVRYSLDEVTLEKLVGATWTPVARKGKDANPAGVPTLYGSWANTPQLPTGSGANPGQNKLWLWSRTPFDYTRNTGSQWGDWFTKNYPDYPCIAPATDRIVCCDFEAVPVGELEQSPWGCSAKPGVTLSWAGPARPVTLLDPPVNGLTHALCLPSEVDGSDPSFAGITIDLSEPAEEMQITVVGQKASPTRICVDFRNRPAGVGPNPRVESGVSFQALGANSKPLVQTRIQAAIGPSRLSGLDCASQLVMALPCSASEVDLLLTYLTAPVTILAQDAQGKTLASVQKSAPAKDAQTVTLQAAGIRRVVIRAPKDKTYLHELCLQCGPGPPVQAWVFDPFRGTPFGPFTANGNVIDLKLQADQIGRVLLGGPGTISVAKLCTNFGPDPADQQRRDELAQHLAEETSRWSQTGEVLEPDTNYRLRVVTSVITSDTYVSSHTMTEFAYFQTEGPPGLTELTAPAGTDPSTFVSGLGDLVRYVKQTVPATVPKAGEKPPLPRPVFRAYDIGVEFDVDYVDLMYRIAGRDLGLYLYDNNNRPVRDAEGRLIVLANAWGISETPSLTDSETHWLQTVAGSKCLTIKTSSIPHNRTLTVAAPGQVLDADTVYEARQVPLLMHEAFADLAVGTFAAGPSGTLGRWTIEDDPGTTGGPSQWQIGETVTPAAHYVSQTSGITGGSTSPTEPLKPGTLLLAGETSWADYRFSVYVRSSTDGAIGIVFRQTDAGHLYRFSLDRAGGYRRLVKLVNGQLTVLAEDDFVYRQSTDYLITIEAVGSSLRVYQDGALVFDVTDTALAAGRIGLYAWSNTGARFSDVRIDDFGAAAPVVYRFKFTTSQCVNFFHLLHSYQDEAWHALLASDPALDAQVATLVAAAADPATAPTDVETRAYASLATLVLQAAALQDPPRVEVTRVDHGTETLGLLVRSPEPIDWTRTSLTVSQAQTGTVRSSTPQTLKLTDATFSAGPPNDESVSVLLRDADDLTGTLIEVQRLPGPLSELSGNPILLDDYFDGADRGLVFREGFGGNALDHYLIVDQGTTLGPSSWTADPTEIVQHTKISDGSTDPTAPDKRGTVALLQAGPWGNLRVRGRLSSDDGGAIGLVFRYRDDSNYYRFSMDSQGSYRRLVKCVAATFTTLWEDSVAYVPGTTYDVVLEAGGDRLVGYVGGQLLFTVRDGDVDSGRVGLYSWSDSGARFQKLEVETLEGSTLLWQAALTDLSELQVVDDPAATGAPSAWAAAKGTLTQTSALASPATGPELPGTYAVGGDPGWEDVALSVRLTSASGGALGVLFRYADDDNYYRFSLDSTGPYRRLVRRAGGVVTVLWQDSQPYTVGQTYALTIGAIGDQLTCLLDGAPLWSLRDTALTHGLVGLYANGDTGASFEQLSVLDPGRTVGRWRVRDDTDASGPSTWTARAGTLRQWSGIGTTAPPDLAGTNVVTGDPTWGDYRMATQLRSDGSGGIGVLVRHVDDDNYYRLSLDAQANQQTFVKRTNGTTTVLWQQPGSYTAGEPFALTVDAIRDRLVGWLGETKLFDLTDPDHPSGGVGLYSCVNTGARFEGVRVSLPPVDARAVLRDDFTADSTVGWTFLDEGTSLAPSAWGVDQGGLHQTSGIFTPPDDPDTLDKKGTNALAGDIGWQDVVVGACLRSDTGSTIGVLFRYADADNYYRFSMDSGRGYRRVVKNINGTFTKLWEDDAAYETGRTYELTIVAIGGMLRGYLDGVPVFIVEDADLASGKIGLYTWNNSDARFSGIRVFPAAFAFGDWLLDDPFDVLDLARWTIVDDGTTNAPSAWAAADGALSETSGIEDGLGPDGIEARGTSALAGDPSWDDYRLSVQLQSDAGGAIGVFIRYQSADAWYRFSLDMQTGARMLIKNIGPTFTALWQDTAVLVPGQVYVLAVDCIGDRLVGYANGVLLFDVSDAALSSGRVGLYSYRNRGAHFLEARVAAPPWTTAYAFAHEPRLPAGTLVRIFSGNANAAPPAEPNIQHRFVGTLDDAGRRLLAADGAVVRIARADGSVEHQRSFVPPSGYAPQNVHVVRKADGTGFFVLPVAAPLQPIDYRLELAYRRDNTAADAESQIFTQAGDSGLEQARIDVEGRTR